MRWLSILLPWVALAQAPSPAATPLTTADLMRAAMDQQRAAARLQAQAAGVWLLPWSTAPLAAAPAAAPDAAPACEPVAETVVTPLIESAAKANDLQPNLVRAVIEQESGYHACATSPKGAQGLMQLMPETAGELGVQDPLDPSQNIAAGARYLKQLLDKYKGDLKLALGAYNAGPGAVEAAGAIPDIPETREYVDAILKKMK